VSGWIGVDFDGTLAEYHGWKHPNNGKPIAPMVDRVKSWIAEGREVRIFTARVAATGDFVSISERRDCQAFAAEMTKEIQDWCERHIGQRLKVTATKDYSCIAIYDDRAVQVRMNTGEIVGEDH